MGLLVVQGPEGDRHDVHVRLPGGATVGELTEALVAGLGRAADGLADHRGRLLRAASPLADTTFRAGAPLHLLGGGAPRVPRSPDPRVVVLAGPCLGRQVEAAGPLEVGREEGQLLLGEDRWASRRHVRLEPGDPWRAEDLGSTNGTVLGGRRLGSRARAWDAGNSLVCGESVLARRGPAPEAATGPGGLVAAVPGRPDGDDQDDLRASLDRAWAGRPDWADRPPAEVAVGWSWTGGRGRRRPAAVSIPLDPGPVVVAGEPMGAAGIVRAMVCRLVLSTSPAGLQVVLAVDADQGLGFVWWLPHATAGAAIAGPVLGVGPTAPAALRRLRTLAAGRRARQGATRVISPWPSVLAVVDRDVLERTGTRVEELEAPDVHLVVRGAPDGHDGTLLEPFEDRWRLRLPQGDETLEGHDEVPEEVAAEVGHALVGLAPQATRSAHRPRAAVPLPRPVVGAATGPPRPVALSDAGLELDLGAFGPHCLVVGAPGSGRTHFLRVVATLLARDHEPSEIELVVVDAHGSGLVSELGPLPHVTLAVEEAGVDVGASLALREGLFGRRSGPRVPKVVLVDGVDRLAVADSSWRQLLRELAGDGRSAGVHVVGTALRLADVPPRLMEAAPLRVCLRTTTQEEALGAVGDPRPGRFSPAEPGRALLRRGAGAPVEFQVPGGATVVGRGEDEVRVAVLDGDRPPVEAVDEVAAVLGRLRGAPAAERPEASEAKPSTQVVRTFLFTDIVRSTALLEAIGDASWEDLVAWHDRTLRGAFIEQLGEEVDHAGDGFFVAFESVPDAVACGIEIQRRLASHRAAHGFAPSVRIGLHESAARRVPGGYVGRGVHVAARVAAMADGGELVATSSSLVEVPVGVLARRRVALDGVREEVELSWLDVTQVS